MMLLTVKHPLGADDEIVEVVKKAQFELSSPQVIE